MSFSQILGHHKQLEALRGALICGRLHHAYLFVGMEGVGKKVIALGLAKAIHCSATAGDFCGECTDCARIQDGNHPDVRIIEPLTGKKEIGIQQIRDLEKKLNFRSFSGKKKIAILDPATLMNLSAQNALLKTLEEPPENSLIILITATDGGLLPTLRSRCLRLVFGPIARDLVAGFLLARKGMGGDMAASLAAMSMGSPGSIVGIETSKLLERRQEWMRLLSGLDFGDDHAAADAAEIFAASKEDSLKFLEWTESWYRDLVVYAVTKNTQNMVNIDMLPQIQEQSARLDMERALSQISETRGAAARIQRNLNRRMVMESLFLNSVGKR
jgi:DNA polymerase III subunit delta'